MAKINVNPGICGLTTKINVSTDDMQTAIIEIDSKCPYISAMQNDIKELDAYSECFARIGEGEVYKSANRNCKHAACPVPSAVIKGMEVACRLALPKNVEIEIDSDLN